MLLKDILKSKITDNMYIVTEQGDIVDLSRFDDNTFDVTFLNSVLSYVIYICKKNSRRVL